MQVPDEMVNREFSEEEKKALAILLDALNREVLASFGVKDCDPFVMREGRHGNPGL